MYPMYYRGLLDRYTGYGQINTRDLLFHFFNMYGEIGPDELIENEKRMKESYDATDSIEVLLDQIENTVKLADNAAQSYIYLQVLPVHFNLMLDTGQFTRSCENGRKTIGRK